jgi:peptidoglycan hydrolase-like protein with peptidoglycan-binding domain
VGSGGALIPASPPALPAAIPSAPATPTAPQTQTSSAEIKALRATTVTLLQKAPWLDQNHSYSERGDDIIFLQLFLIVSDTGPAARALLMRGATGYFGTLTVNALAEFQSAVGISPARGNFGPKTRAYIRSFTP